MGQRNCARISLAIILSLTAPSSAAAAEDPLDYIVLLVRDELKGGSWKLRTRADGDGSQFLSAPADRRAPCFHIDKSSGGGDSPNSLVVKAITNILQKYVDDSVGSEIEQSTKTVSYCKDRRSSNAWNDFVLVHRKSLKEYFEPFRDGDYTISRDSQDYTIVGFIDVLNLNAEMARVEGIEEKVASDAAELLKLASSDSKEKVYYLQFIPQEGGAKAFSESSCTIKKYVDGTDPSGIYISAFQQVLSSERKQDDRPKSFTVVYDDIEDAFRTVLSGRNCYYYVDFAKNIYAIAYAIQRDYPDQGLVLYSKDANIVLANSRGFKRVEEFELAKAMNADSSTYGRLNSAGITSLDKFNNLVKEMNDVSYAQGADPDDLLSYLSDKNEGSRKKKTAVKVRQDRERTAAAAEKKAKAAEAAGEARRKAAAAAAEKKAKAVEAAALAKRAAEFPYYAVLYCEVGFNLTALTVCLSDTTLRIRSGSDSGVYGADQIDSGSVPNSWTERGFFYVNLRKKYYVEAQNSGEEAFNLVLRIYKNRSSELIFSRSVSGYGVVKASN